jgi:NADP-dependent 3-hydroxy acid dehydrogenase YdfG
MGLGMVTYDFSGKVALVTGAAGGIGRPPWSSLPRALP